MGWGTCTIQTKLGSTAFKVHSAYVNKLAGLNFCDPLDFGDHVGCSDLTTSNTELRSISRLMICSVLWSANPHSNRAMEIVQTHRFGSQHNPSSFTEVTLDLAY